MKSFANPWKQTLHFFGPGGDGGSGGGGGPGGDGGPGWWRR